MVWTFHEKIHKMNCRESFHKGYIQLTIKLEANHCLIIYFLPFLMMPKNLKTVKHALVCAGDWGSRHFMRKVIRHIGKTPAIKAKHIYMYVCILPFLAE